MIEEFPQSNVTTLDMDNDIEKRWNEGKSPIDDYSKNKFAQDNPHKHKRIKYQILNNSWDE